MEKKEDPNCSSSTENDDSPKDDDEDQIQELLQPLEQQTSWNGQRIIKYDGFWCPEMFIRSTLACQKHFKSKDGDIILATLPKCGTTWLKALTFSIAKRHIYPIDQSHPLLTSNPHTLVPFLQEIFQDLENIPNNGPRFFSTHVHFNILPDSVRESGCRIIYICRNPLDQFVSARHFLLENKIEKDTVPMGLDEAFHMFCRGIHAFGPFWDSILGYWNAHLKNPEKVLFLKYEDLKEDINSNVKKIAEFVGCPFSMEEEKQGMIEEISSLCSLDNLKNLEVNKNGYVLGGLFKNSSFFRKGEVGGWTNCLTPAMVERIEKLMESKLEGSGLMFKI